MSRVYLRGLENAFNNSSTINISSDGTDTLLLPAYARQLKQHPTSAVFTHPAVGAVAGALCLLLLCLLAKPVSIPEAARQRLQRRREGDQEKQLESEVDPEMRAAMIQKSLTVQRVVNADEAGNMELGELHVDVRDKDEYNERFGGARSPAYAKSALSVEASCDAEHRIASCCICLEPYKVGDVVAWSRRESNNRRNSQQPQQECLHVFHQECILQWLVNPEHDDCPSCRSTIIILQTNEDGEKEHEEKGNKELATSTTTDESALRGSGSNNSTAFVSMHGLISRVRLEQAFGLSTATTTKTPTACLGTGCLGSSGEGTGGKVVSVSP